MVWLSASQRLVPTLAASNPDSQAALVWQSVGEKCLLQGGLAGAAPMWLSHHAGQGEVKEADTEMLDPEQESQDLGLA